MIKSQHIGNIKIWHFPENLINAQGIWNTPAFAIEDGLRARQKILRVHMEIFTLFGILMIGNFSHSDRAIILNHPYGK
jgi:hypothetical protein